jgi:Flp pilus assembly pilin Flp
METILKRLWHEEDGQESIGYALGLGLMGLAAVGYKLGVVNWGGAVAAISGILYIQITIVGRNAFDR